ncbi:MAG: HugZ family protein [Gammaproteobacteria bacterium]|nr:HugZ family protein [Gammaproteobacteria bacterium]MCP5200317.1 HugZ family protein [Gammaproteobacteria bacterium]
MSKTAAAHEARELLAACYDGVLATLSVDVDGYPFGSVVPYCLDRDARPVILIASIAQHSKNVRHDARVSLTVFDRGVDELQTSGRVTYLGECERLAPGPVLDDVRERYFRYFPEAMDYDRTHDFAFHAITPRRVRYIGGFGDIHWFEPDRMLVANPFDAAAERGIVDHMNADHADAVRHYCTLVGVAVPDGVTPLLVGCDGEGVNIRLDRRIVRLAFDAPAGDLAAVRATLVGLARREPA